MTLDVVNSQNQKVGDVDLNDAVFGGTIKKDLVWASVVRQNASDRAGTHATKNRALVSGGGRKPYKQKGTGRPQAGSTRSPLWRKGGTVFGPQPRSYDFHLSKKVERGALRAALQTKLKDGVIIVVDELKLGEIKTRAAAELLASLGVTGKTLMIDVKLDDNLVLASRNLPGVRMVPSGRLTARDVMDTRRIVATRAAVERLQEVLG
ncbi:MAG: 50S ribosomal protein L4 [Acidobacteria bacterium]|nr:50S ribosomal protein L4 [Acidobacteriota bacterium]